MKLIDRIENANSIANGLKPNEVIDAKVIYDLQLHLSEAIELVKLFAIPFVRFSLPSSSEMWQGAREMGFQEFCDWYRKYLKNEA